MDIVLDTSVIMKWFLPEPGSAAALVYRKQVLSGELKLKEPELLFYEVSNVMATKRGATLRAVNGAMEILYQTPMQVIPFNQSMSELAIQIVHKYKVSVYDGVYIAIACQNGCRFVTADQKLFQKISTLRKVSLLGERAISSEQEDKNKARWLSHKELKKALGV